MRVEPTRQGSSGRSSGTPRDASLAPAERDAESRALVVQAAPAVRQPSANYRQAQFLAQLIATKDQLPQTRKRRRAEPQDVIAAYRTAAALTGH